MLLFDGHDSHISRDWFAHCLDNKIIPALLVPHSSHLTQPLDISIFSPLKKTLSQTLTPLLITQVHRIHKAEWLLAFIKAYNIAFMTQNIKSAFSGAGLIPFDPEKVLHHIAPPPPPPPSASDTQVTTNPPPSTPSTPFHKEVLTSSPIDRDDMLKANAKIIDLMASATPLNTPARNYVTCLVRRNNRLQARNTILEQRVDAATALLSGRKE